METIRIDPAKVLHPVPAIRGVMTEWMFAEGEADTGRSVDPTGVEYGYGRLLSLTEEDIARAAEIGVNTIRCAVEHASLEDDKRPGVYKEAGFRRLTQLLDWYAAHGIKGIIDLHNALGRVGGGDPRLWRERAYQDRFVAVWREVVRRYKGHPAVAAYEPINEAEPPDNDYAVWNRLATRTTDAIRTIGRVMRMDTAITTQASSPSPASIRAMSRRRASSRPCCWQVAHHPKTVRGRRRYFRPWAWTTWQA
jgi:aryl-phospho-beta-D-glucosidase BglC (GH1 family)